MKDKHLKAFMKTAYTFAECSHALRLKVGVVIVKDNRIISIGYNGTPHGWDNECEYKSFFEGDKQLAEPKLVTRSEVLHAETNAIAKVAQSSESCKDAVLFCTHEPCIECAKLIFQSGISEVYFKNTYDAAKGSGRDFLEKSGCVVEHLSE